MIRVFRGVVVVRKDRGGGAGEGVIGFLGLEKIV